jgi:GNAT superfamily N-acetyltransferase
VTPDETLERTQWDFFWIPDDAEVADRPELAYVRCVRPVSALNCATRIRAAAEQLPALVEEVRGAHAGRRSKWLVCPQNRTAALERSLVAGGYAPTSDHDGYVLGVHDYQRRPAADVVVHQVDSHQRLVDCVRVMCQAFDGPWTATAAELQHDLELCTGAGARVQRYVAYDQRSAEPIASAGLTAYPALRFGFLWAGGTVPHARGRGAYSALVAARIQRAAQLGIDAVGLYAKLDTSAPIVAKQGFTRHGRMTYWETDVGE